MIYDIKKQSIVRLAENKQDNIPYIYMYINVIRIYSISIILLENFRWIFLILWI